MATLDFYAFGVSRGYTSFHVKDKHKAYLDMFYSNLEKEYGRKMYVYKRKDGDVFYSLLVYKDAGKNFLDSCGRPGSFFGMTLVFNGLQFKDARKVWTVLNDVYDNSIKGNIISDNSECKKYLVGDLGTSKIEQFICNGFKKEFKNLDLNKELVGFCYKEGDPANRQVFTFANSMQARQNNDGR